MNLETLNQQQKRAVLHMEGPARVIAGAGAGKTRVLTHRIINLLEQGIAPERITACTFTKKAAKEISERVVSMYGIEADEVNMATLHSIGYHLLKRVKKDQGINKIKLIESGTTWLWFSNFIKKHDLKIKDVKKLLGAIGSLKLNIISVDTLKEQLKSKLSNSAFDHTNDDEVAIYYVYRHYQSFLASNQYVDFSDMLYESYVYMANPANAEFTKKIVNKIDYLLVDEFQDTNLVSYELYKILGSKYNNVMVVGDPRQAIYSFQGSDWKFLDHFLKEFKAIDIQSPTNYRSTKTIVDASNVLIANNCIPNILPTTTPNIEGPPITVMRSLTELDEAFNVLDLVKKKISEGIEPDDIAILYRVNAQAYPFIDLFTANDIPFVVHSKDSFFNRKEIKQIVSYMKIIVNPSESEYLDFKNVANAPLRYIKNASLDEIDDNISSSFYDAAKSCHMYLDNRQSNAIHKLVMDIENGMHLANSGEMSTKDLLFYVLKDIGLLEFMQSEEGKNSDFANSKEHDKMINIDVLMGFATKYEDPKKFLAFAEQMKKEDAERKKDTKKRKGVHLLTMHSSKGLEFDNVIIAGACSRLMPFYKSHGNDEGLEEERRLAYVGVTRPKNKLYISAITKTFGRYKVKPTFYLSEMGLHDA